MRGQPLGTQGGRVQFCFCEVREVASDGAATPATFVPSHFEPMPETGACGKTLVVPQSARP